MGDREFFNSLAYEWDERCKHDSAKVEKILELSNIEDNSTILDVGCGTGILEKFLLKYNPVRIDAVDLAERMIEVANIKYNDERINFIAKDVLEHKGEYDYIFIYSAYPHFKDKDRLLMHLTGLLNKGGRLVVAHSQSRNEINKIHGTNKSVKDDVLPSAKETSAVFNKYLDVEIIIDNEDMYFVSGVFNKK